MSILIRGMEMPKGNSTINVLIYADGTVYTGHVNDSQYSTVSVPTPHGRLGDLDKLWDRMYNYIDNEGAKMPFGDNDFMIHKDSACELIENMPTIIEAEGSKT